MPEWLLVMLQMVGSGVALAVCLAVPKIWVDSILNREKLAQHSDKFSGIFQRLDKMGVDVSYIRGTIDGKKGGE